MMRKIQDSYYLTSNITPPVSPVGLKRIPEEYAVQDGYWISPVDASSMLLVAEGSCLLGNDGPCVYEDEQPQHDAYSDSFLMDVYKVRRESYQLFLEDINAWGGHHSRWCHPEEPAKKSHIPMNWSRQTSNLSISVTGVDWYDAWAYAQWAEKSLPTEAQWEKACYSIFTFGAEENNKKKIQHLIGKGWEWCLDWYQSDYYKNCPRYEPCCLKKSAYKVAKGSIQNATLPLGRASFRNRYPLLHRQEMLGFRCIKKFIYHEK